MAERPVHFIVPGPIAQRTGGYGYDRRIVERLRALGRAVDVVELEGAFPFCCDTAKASAAAALTAVPDGAVAVIDGLALPAFDRALSPHLGRIAFFALIHHPLALETGLSDCQRMHLAAVEGALIGQADGVVVTSPATAELLSGQDLDAGAITVVLPGTDPAPRAAGSAGPAVQLLCVGTLIARKGHAVLIEALAQCTELPWRLSCLGALDRDPATVAVVRERLAAHELAARVQLAGEADEAVLDAAYAAADLFVLASAFEGYGMAFAEALARGLPIVGSGDGALRHTVPESAGVIVPVGDRDALAAALRRVIGDGALRRRLADGAHAAGQCLPDWTQSGRAFAAALDRAAAR